MKTVSIAKVLQRHFVEQDGKLVEVKKNTSVDHYTSDVTIYENKLAKGKLAGQSEYWVAVKEHQPSRKASAKAQMSAIMQDLFKNGLTPEQVKAKYNIDIQ